MNRSCSNNLTYSKWRKNANVNSYFFNSYIEYVSINDNSYPYLLVNVIENASSLENYNWHNSILNFKRKQVEFLRQFSKSKNIPWLIIVFSVENNTPKFKIYNDKRTFETIYSEQEYIAILEGYKKELLAKIKN